jgi:hypothetical protein
MRKERPVVLTARMKMTLDAFCFRQPHPQAALHRCLDLQTSELQALIECMDHLIEHERTPLEYEYLHSVQTMGGTEYLTIREEIAGVLELHKRRETLKNNPPVLHRGSAEERSHLLTLPMMSTLDAFCFRQPRAALHHCLDLQASELQTLIDYFDHLIEHEPTPVTYRSLHSVVTMGGTEYLSIREEIAGVLELHKRRAAWRETLRNNPPVLRRGSADASSRWAINFPIDTTDEVFVCEA